MKKAKVIGFKGGKPEILGEVQSTAHKQAWTLLGVCPSVERVRGFGFCFVRDTDGAQRSEWNRSAA